MEKIELTQFGALAILFAAMFLGEVVTKLTKGKIPGALTISVIMLAGFWTIFPLDLVERAGVTDLIYSLCAMLIVTNLGTLISRKQMIQQWRTVVICLAGIVAIVGITMTLSAAIFGTEIAVAATPPLTGGAIATLMMVEAAGAKGLLSAAVVALICFVMQGLVGYPLTSIFLRKESKRLLALYQKGDLKLATAGDEGSAKKESAFTKIKTPTFILLKLVLLCLASYWMETLILTLSGGAVNISRYVWALVFGFIGSEVKFLEHDAVAASKSDGILMSLLLIYLFGGLNAATMELFFAAVVAALPIVLIAAAGMALVAFIMSKVFKKESFSMCYCIILNAFYGFPINVMLTNEATEAATDDPEARAAISAQIMPKMLVGGFTSVTIVSVLVAGVMLNYL